MRYIDKLKEKESVVCVGLDPIIEKIPLKEKTIEETIFSFFKKIIEAINNENIPIGAVKPNIAFYEQYGFEGLRALKRVIELAKQHNHIIILDAKLGDIGKTSAAYAKAVFDFWGVDSVTVAPYMGFDSVSPFIDYCKKGKGVYILARTSNPGAKDFQDFPNNTPLYKQVSKRIIDWHTNGLGAVFGATYPRELEEVSALFTKSKKQITLLIPGIGTQGGSLRETIEILKKNNKDIRLHRINSSSGIIYAYEKEKTDDFVGAALREIKKMNEVIGK